MIVPVLYRVLVKPYDIFDKDESYAAAKRMGLEVVGDSKKREQQSVDKGTVMAIGPSCGEDLFVSVGDEIVWARHAGKEVVDPENGETFVVVNDDDIVAVLKNGAKDGR